MFFMSLKAKQETKQKQNNYKRKTYQKLQSQHKTERQKHKHETKTKATGKKETANNSKQVGFEKGDVRKVCFKETSNTLTKEKAPKTKKEETPQKEMFSKKGLMDKRQRKTMNSEREDRRKTRENRIRTKRRILKDKPFGGWTTRGKPLKLCKKIEGKQGKNIGLFQALWRNKKEKSLLEQSKRKKQKTRQQKQKNWTRKTLFACWQTTPNFW